MATKITSWKVLREDGKNIAWVNGIFIGVVSDEQVSAYETACPTKHAPDVVESAASSDISPAPEVSALRADSTPATTQVKRTVLRHSPNRKKVKRV